jgi:GNAT superfamily N-acetyltransferase
MLTFFKPHKQDLPSVAKILAQWNDEAEVQKYVDRVRQEIQGKTKYDMRFWVLKFDSKVIGMGGLADCQPKLKPFLKTKKAKEIKALYLDQKYRGKGYGRRILGQLEKMAQRKGYRQMLLVSAERYENTAYGFYEHLGFKKQGHVKGGAPGKLMAVFSKLL